MVAHGAPLEPRLGILAPPGSLLGASWEPLGGFLGASKIVRKRLQNDSKMAPKSIILGPQDEVLIGSGKRDLVLHEKALKTYIYVFEAGQEPGLAWNGKLAHVGASTIRAITRSVLERSSRISLFSEVLASISEK